MEISKAFGAILRRNREEKGMSQEQLALDCGLDRTFISLLERGLRQPPNVVTFGVTMPSAFWNRFRRVSAA